MSQFEQLQSDLAGNSDSSARILSPELKKQFETLRNGGSYLSRNDPRIHFGLGNCSQVDAATILWPSGSVQRMKDLESHPILDALAGESRAEPPAKRPTSVKRPMGERSPVNLAEVPVYGEYH